MHGLPRTEISNLRETFGDRFNAVIVVREPVARLRSQMALYGEFRGVDGWDLSYAETLIESENIPVDSEESRLFVHAANMLNAVTDEISRFLTERSTKLKTRDGFHKRGTFDLPLAGSRAGPGYKIAARANNCSGKENSTRFAI
jgi:hypothetical protein